MSSDKPTGLKPDTVVNFPVSIPHDVKVAFYALVPKGQHSKVIAKLVRAYVNKEMKKRNATSSLEEKAV